MPAPEKGEGKTRLVGDVDFAAAAARAGWITPVPGGVGPLTIAMLLRNTLAAAESPQRDQIELAFQATLGPVLMAARGWSAPEVGTAIERARQLCSRIGTVEDQFFVMWGLWGWRVISPGAPFTEGSAYNDDKFVKAIILLTDGENNKGRSLEEIEKSWAK